MNATEHGTAAALALLGAREPFAPMSYFWTDQFDVKIHVHGLPPANAECRLVEGNPRDGRFSAVYTVAGRVQASLAWNYPREARRLRQAVADQQPIAELDSARTG